MPCPLKEAALDAPNQTAMIVEGKKISYRELDQIVDQTSLSFVLKTKNNFELILKLLKSIREKSIFFPINPHIPGEHPQKPAVHNSLLLYTSGSTAHPKIAILPYQALIQNAQDAVEKLELKPTDQWKLSLPLYHVGGVGIVLRCILARATIVLGDSLDITFLSYVPTLLYRSTPIYRSLRCLLLGGGPIPNIPKNLPIQTTYGLTEMGSMVTLNGSILPNRKVMISQENEILVKGPTLFSGYLGEKKQKDWFATGDLGFIKKDRITITGRKDWMFISGGENIQPEEIEAALLTHPSVYEAAVLPIHSDEFGKQPVAIVRAETNFNLKVMQHHLEPLLPRFKIPKKLIFIRNMPIKSNFKLNRFVLSQIINLQLDQNKAGQKKTAYL